MDTPETQTITPTFRQVSHLSRRAGFGLPPTKLSQLAARGLSAAISYYVDFARLPQNVPLTPPPLKTPDDGDVTPVQTWWLDRMMRSQRQLEEKMTLFWHGFFATSNAKVFQANYMYEQNTLLREKAMGDFQDLLGSVAIDRAMLVWLDGNWSTKDQPNENFGRESMELFSIGLNYTQADVKDAARAYTGYYLDDLGVRQYSADNHDDGIKTVLGERGKWGTADMARILANHPLCGPFLVRKLWTFFAYERPEPAVVNELAKVYTTSKRSISAVVRHMFGMPAFYRTADVPVRVKTPVEYVVTAVRELNATVTLTDVNDYLYGMGQYLFYPPNVGGWPSGPRWINSATVVSRFGFAEWLLEQHDDPTQNRVDMSALLKYYAPDNWPAALNRLQQYLLGSTVSPLTINALRNFVHGTSPKGPHGQALLEPVLQLTLVSPEYYCA